MQIFQHALPVVLLIIILADIDVVSAVLEHTVDEPSQFVGGGRGRFGSPETGLLAPKISAQGTVAVMKSAGGQAQRLGRAVSAGLGFAIEQFAAGFFCPGHKLSQEVKCLLLGQRLMSKPISETTTKPV